MKNITGIKDDDILKELWDKIIINKSGNVTSNIISFSQKYPEINLQKIMEQFQQSEYSSYNFSDSQSSFRYETMDTIFHKIYEFLIIYTIIGIVSFVASFLFNAFLTVSSSRQTTRIRSMAFRSLLKQEIAWHEKTSPGELSSRIISDSILIEEGIGNKFGILLQNICTFVACFVMAFLIGWKLTLSMAIILPILIIVVTISGSILTKYTKKSQDTYAELGGIAQEAFSQIRTIVSFGNEEKEIDRYVHKLKPTKKYEIIKCQTFGTCLGLIFCIVYCSYSIAFIRGSHYINDGKMEGSDVLKVLMSVIMGAMSFSGCGNIMNAFSEATGAASNLFHIIERKPKIDTKVGERPRGPIHGDIEFRNVHFSYPSRPEVEILKGISFKCHPGQMIALVGASGSGKSTIIQLLERYYVTSEEGGDGGEILIDGQPIDHYNIHWLRTQIGLVSQEPTLFDATIAENISINCPEATQEEIEVAAKLANAHEFISKLPKGYQTSTGERGLQLSGGQKQRICIARALMTNPKILLLDEATSALDNQSEKVVQAALDSASSGRTTLVIAHRLTTVKDADLIIVMDKGVIIESGNHNELMTKKSVYYNLVKNQEMNIHKTKISDEEEDDDDHDHDHNYDKDNSNNINDVDNNKFNSVSMTKKSTDITEYNVPASEAEYLKKRVSITLSRIISNISNTPVEHRQTTIFLFLKEVSSLI
jgi:ABC-type multidrug transport system fused ATPase/permease subunit